jgi:hypothetical protein
LYLLLDCHAATYHNIGFGYKSRVEKLPRWSWPHLRSVPAVAFKEELEACKQGKGSVQFPLTQALPLDLIERIFRFRMAESLTKA